MYNNLRYGTIRVNNSATGFTTSATSQIVAATVAAPGPSNTPARLVIDMLQLSTDASGNFTGIALLDAAGGTIMSTIWAMLGSDFINTGPFYNLRMTESKGLFIQRTAVAGTLYYDIAYHIEGK